MILEGKMVPDDVMDVFVMIFIESLKRNCILIRGVDNHSSTSHTNVKSELQLKSLPDIDGRCHMQLP